MKFDVAHHFDAPAARVVDLMLDPSFEASVKLPDVALPEVLEANTNGTHAVLRLRYEYTGSLDPIARRFLGSGTLTWIQELRFDRARGAGTLTFTAESNPGALNTIADLTVQPDGDGSVRRLTGDFRVKVPLIGGMAERKILPGVLARLDVEADALRAKLAEIA